MNVSTKHALESIASRLPVPIQNLGFSVLGAKSYRLRYSGEFGPILASLRRSEWDTLEGIKSLQMEQLASTLESAVASVPFYRQHPGIPTTTCIHQDPFQALIRFPVINKHKVRCSQTSFISERRDLGALNDNLTSGTSGVPLNVRMTLRAMRFQWAVWWRHRARFGLRLGDPFLTFGARLPVPITQDTPPFWRTNRAIGQTYLSSYHIKRENLRAIVDWLNDSPFDFYAGYPSAMNHLATLIEAEGLRVTMRPKCISTGSDALHPSYSARIGRVFGANVTEQYGMAEACGNLSKCEAGRFHLDHEFCFLELFPPPDGADANLRRLVFTGFANLGMPLIRYDIGDLVEVDDVECKCGRMTPSFPRIVGRSNEYVKTVDGRLAMGLNQVFEWAPGLAGAQIVQHSLDRLEIRVMPGNGFSKTDLEIVEQEMRKRVGHRITIEFAVVEAFEATKAGKHPIVISRLPASS